MFPYFLQTPLFAHINYLWIIPSKPGVIFVPSMFLNFCVKNIRPISRNGESVKQHILLQNYMTTNNKT